MKKIPLPLVKGGRFVLITLLVIASLIMLVGCFMLRGTVPQPSPEIWLPLIPAGVFLLTVILRLARVIRVPVLYLSLILFSLSVALFAFDMLVTRKSSALMMVTPVHTRLYTMTPPSVFSLLEKEDGYLRFGVGDSVGLVELRVFRPISPTNNSGLSDLMGDYMRSPDFLRCCRRIGEVETGNVNGFPIIMSDYRYTAEEKQCRLSFIRGNMNFHFLEFCAPPSLLARHAKDFRLLIASIRRIE